MHPTETYIRAIRNQGKREYAEDYRSYLYGEAELPDYHAYNVSLMAAQAVEMSLVRITGDENTRLQALYEDDPDNQEACEPTQDISYKF